MVKANTGQFDKLPSLITSELTKNPDIDYVQTEVDFAVQPIVEGLQAANATSVKVASMDGVLATLQMLDGGQFVHSEMGFNADALAWYAADDALRMMTGQPANVEGRTSPTSGCSPRRTSATSTSPPRARSRVSGTARPTTGTAS